MEAVVDAKHRPALYRHGGGMVEAQKLGSPAAAAAWGGAIEPAAGVYLECLRNHAASAGGHVVDGCGEFMPAPAAPTRCAACGCHRSFHRRVVTADGPPPPPPRLALLPPPSTVVKAAAPHLLPRGEGTSPEKDRVPGGAGVADGGGWDDETDEDSDYYYDGGGRPMSPLPGPAVSPSPYPSPAPPPHTHLAPAAAACSRPPPPPLAAARKRFRSKFSPEQKRRMWELSERLGWRLRRRDEAAAADCCRDIGVTRAVFKFWMHNNKHSFVAGGLHTARRNAASSASPASPVVVPAPAVTHQPSSRTASADDDASASPPPPVIHADFNINGPAAADYYVVQPATASAGAPQPSYS